MGSWISKAAYGDANAVNGQSKVINGIPKETNGNRTKRSGLYITGLARQYPSHIYPQDEFEVLLKRLIGDGVNVPVIQKLLRVSKNSGISARASVTDWHNCPEGLELPPIDELSRIFRTAGVNLTVKACEQALAEAKVKASDITHTVGATCTDTGNPGYDVIVAQKLKLHQGVERALVHGVGCAGGLVALRQAANIAAGATQRQRPARILVFACEICSNLLRGEVDTALERNEVRVGPALFGDAAAALVVCNELGLNEGAKPIYDVLDWGVMTIPGTYECMDMMISPKGFLMTLTKEVPKHSVMAIIPMFEKMRHSMQYRDQKGNLRDVKASNCDWAIHPGGAAILAGAQMAMNISEEQLRASWEIYRNYGNTSSPTVLIVLDQLRKMGDGRDNVVATSFGPGLIIEMCTMRRSRSE